MSDDVEAATSGKGGGRARIPRVGDLPAGERRKDDRLPFERFIERSLHEAYAETLRQAVPDKLLRLLSRLEAAEDGS